MEIITAEQFKQKAGVNSSKTEAMDRKVLEIINQVRKTGDQALFSYTKQFDGAALDTLIVSEKEFDDAKKLVNPEVFQALQKAKDNIEHFHRQQIEKSWFIEKEQGITLGQKITPMEKTGVYIPGGKAAYPSTVLMNVIPAKIAGVKK